MSIRYLRFLVRWLTRHSSHVSGGVYVSRLNLFLSDMRLCFVFRTQLHNVPHTLLLLTHVRGTKLLTCICLTAGVNLVTPSGHRQIRDVITTGIDMCGRRMRKGGGGDGPYIRRAAD